MIDLVEIDMMRQEKDFKKGSSGYVERKERVVKDNEIIFNTKHKYHY